MYVTYFDEVKADPRQGQNCYWIGGVSLPMSAIAEVEAKLNQLAKDVFGSSELVPGTEFHCKHLYGGKAHFKGMPVQDRIDLLVALVQIIKDHEAIKRVLSVIDTERLVTPQNVPEIAFGRPFSLRPR